MLLPMSYNGPYSFHYKHKTIRKSHQVYGSYLWLWQYILWRSKFSNFFTFGRQRII